MPDTPVTQFCAAGRVVSSFKVRCMRSWRRFCCGWPGLMRSISCRVRATSPTVATARTGHWDWRRERHSNALATFRSAYFENFIAQCRAPHGIFGNAASAAEQGCVPNFGDPPTLR